ncbi:MAG: sugar phosphate isomerase/epimerase family protein [Thermoanaerobaculia bacterium]
MSDWEVGLSTGCFYRRPFLDCLPQISAGGFSLVEVCSHADHLDYHDPRVVRLAARELERLGMECYSFHGPFAEPIDLSAPDPQFRKGALAKMLQAVEAAAVLGARYFVLHPGPDRIIALSDEERRARLAHAAESVTAVCRRCRELGPELVLENMLPHLALGSQSDFFTIVDTLAGEVPGFCLDTGHAHLSGNMQELLIKMKGRLRMLHGNDNRGYYDDHFPPGQGSIDWVAVARGLGATGFCGGIILELASSTDAERTLREAREARLLLHHLAQEAMKNSHAAPIAQP